MKHFIDTERKSNILNHTPMGRFGKPEELIGAINSRFKMALCEHTSQTSEKIFMVLVSTLPRLDEPRDRGREFPHNAIIWL